MDFIQKQLPLCDVIIGRWEKLTGEKARRIE